MEQKLLPNGVRWLTPNEYPDSGGYTMSNGVTVYPIGEEYEYIITFQDVSTTDFVTAVFEFEMEMERYDSKEENDVTFADYAQAVEIVALSLTDNDTGWYVNWAGGNPNRNILALMLNRW